MTMLRVMPQEVNSTSSSYKSAHNTLLNTQLQLPSNHVTKFESAACSAALQGCNLTQVRRAGHQSAAGVINSQQQPGLAPLE